jgi:glycosyltransferase involved in cell wall biosynthesis
MRILHVIGSLDESSGGPAQACVGLCRELARRGENVSIYSLNGKYLEAGRIGRVAAPLYTPVRRHGVEIRYFPYSGTRYYVWSVPLAMTLYKDVPHFDIVHIHSVYSFHFGAASLVCRRFGVPYLVRLHGTLDPYVRNQRRLRKYLHALVIDRWALAGAAAVHFTAQEEMEDAVGAQYETGFRDLQRRAVVIPNGVDVPQLESRGQMDLATQSLLARFPELRAKRVVLFLGRLDRQKGLDIISDAFGRICKVRDDVQLVIAGPDNDNYGHKIRKQLIALGVARQVTFTGMLLGAEKSAAFRLADVFVLPSYGENFAIAAVEAMAHGLAVVISNRVKIWREIAAARAGTVINCDAAELADAIGRLLDDNHSRREMGERGRQLVTTRFSWPTVAGQVLDLYRSIASASRPPLEGVGGLAL